MIDHRIAIGSFNALDHPIVALFRADRPLGGRDDLLPAGLDIGGRHLAAVVKFHPLMQGFFGGSLLDCSRRRIRGCRELSESEVELEIIQPRNTWVHVLREQLFR